MTKIYYVIAERHKNSSHPNPCLFYDYDREEAIKFIEKYNKNMGLV